MLIQHWRVRDRTDSWRYFVVDQVPCKEKNLLNATYFKGPWWHLVEVWQFRDTTIQDEVMRMTWTRVSLLLLGVELLGHETYHISTSVSTTCRIFFIFSKRKMNKTISCNSNLVWPTVCGTIMRISHIFMIVGSARDMSHLTRNRKKIVISVSKST
jgi:hypothetical protein